MKVLFGSLALLLVCFSPKSAIAQSSHAGSGSSAYDGSFVYNSAEHTINTLHSNEGRQNIRTLNTFQFAAPSTHHPSRKPMIRSLSSYDYAKTYTQPHAQPQTNIQNMTKVIRIERQIIPSECPKGTQEQSDGSCLKTRKVIETLKPVILTPPCPEGTIAKENGTCIKRQKVIVKKTPLIVKASCPKGTTDAGDGTCLRPAKKIIQTSPVIIAAACPKGTKEQKDGTCLEPAKKVVTQAPIIISAKCPKGTQDKGDGTCLEPAKKIVKAKPVIITSPCPKGTKDNEDGTCSETVKKVVKQKPRIVTETCPKGTKDQGDGTCLKPRQLIEQAPKIVNLPCPKGTTRHYSGDSCISKPQLVGENISKKKKTSQTPSPKKMPVETKKTKLCDPGLNDIMSDDTLAGGLGAQDTSCISLQ